MSFIRIILLFLLIMSFFIFLATCPPACIGVIFAILYLEGVIK